jgi:hypothetical protein
VRIPIVVLVVAACGQVDNKVTVDAMPPIDVAPASCTDGLRNGTETDLDCGGACAACAVGRTCMAARDCVNGTCFAGTCGDRMWFAESTGDSIAVPGNQTWVAAAGTTAQIQLYARSMVFLRWTGTSRFVGGGNGLCHLGQRFVIDGVPTGNPTWGNAIAVSRGSTRWHAPFHLELAVPLDAGMHTIATEMTNASGYATCNLDGDGGLAYDRSRLAIAAYDPGEAWYAESNTTTGPLASGGGWIDLPGVAVTVPLAAVNLVHVSLQGSQLAQNGTHGHCAYRLVVDGTPLGDPNHGQAISVGDVSGGWWSPVAIKWGVALNAGSHTITAQIRNSGGPSGTCEANESTNPYSRFRLFATASAVGGANQAYESTGAAQILGSNSAWTQVNGLQASVNTGVREGTVQIELAGTQRSVGSPSSGHCAYRLVVDGTPLGDANHGMAIDVSDGANTWWTYAGLVWGTRFAPGAHDVKVEVRNSSASGDCGVNGDDLPYGRTRMFVRHL